MEKINKIVNIYNNKKLNCYCKLIMVIIYFITINNYGYNISKFDQYKLNK